MATDDERRTVVERLRSLRSVGAGVTNMNHGYMWSLLWAASGEELSESELNNWFERFCARLADLIEPEERKGIESDAFDREALLALADELETDGVDCYNVSTQYVCDQYARRIREALGVVA